MNKKKMSAEHWEIQHVGILIHIHEQKKTKKARIILYRAILACIEKKEATIQSNLSNWLEMDRVHISVHSVTER